MYLRMHSPLSRCIIALLSIWIVCGCAMSTASTPTVPVPVSPSQTASTLPATAQPTTPPPSATPAIPATPTLAALDQDTRERIFETVWTTVSDHYVYRDFRGVDWQKSYDDYLPKALQAPTSAAFYRVIQEMIDALNDQHTRYDDPQQAAMGDAIYNGQAEYAGIGIMVRELNQGLLITRIAEEGPAEQAGLRPYDIITMVDSTPITPTYLLGDGDYGSLIRGPVGSRVTITYTRGDTANQTLEVVRDVIRGDAFPEAVATRNAHGLIVLTIDSFDRDHLASLVQDALLRAAGDEPVTGLIIDVRENGGGSIEDMLSVISLFHDGGSIGTQVDRNNIYQLHVPTRRVMPGYADIPIVILTSSATASAAEMFSAGMRHLRAAVIIGETTAGNSENLFPYDLEDGSVLWVAELLYKQPNGSFIEDVGIVPDIVLTDAWEQDETTDDPFIHAAVDYLTKTHPTP